MNWFFNWLEEKIRHSARKRRHKESLLPVESDDHEKRIDADGIHFTVYRAVGGFIIEYKSYDRKNDSRNIALHIVTDDKDLGIELSKILSFEALRY